MRHAGTARSEASAASRARLDGGWAGGGDGDDDDDARSDGRSVETAESAAASVYTVDGVLPFIPWAEAAGAAGGGGRDERGGASAGAAGGGGRDERGGASAGAFHGGRRAATASSAAELSGVSAAVLSLVAHLRILLRSHLGRTLDLFRCARSCAAPRVTAASRGALPRLPCLAVCLALLVPCLALNLALCRALPCLASAAPLSARSLTIQNTTPRIRPPPLPRRVRCRQWDFDGDGSISLADLSHALVTLHGLSPPAEAIRALHSALDT
jgi:hypothetical protein